MNVKSGVTVKAGVVVARAVFDGALAYANKCEWLPQSRVDKIAMHKMASEIELAVMSQLGQVLDFYGGGDVADAE